MNRISLSFLLLPVIILARAGGLEAQEPCPGVSAAVVFQAQSTWGERFQSPELFANSREEIGLAGSGPTRFYAALVSAEPGEGVQGWSLSLAIDGGVEILRATTEGTAGAARPEGVRSQTSWERTEIAEPERNDGQKGVVSSVVLALLEDIQLYARGTATVLAVDVEPAASTGEGPLADGVGSVRCQDGLLGSDQAVENLLTISGRTFLPCECRPGSSVPASPRSSWD